MVTVDFARRRQELLDECKIAPDSLGRVMERLGTFMEPFIQHFVRSEQEGHARTFVRGLLSDVDHKNVETIAYRFGQDRMPLQWFIGVSEWNHEPLRDELVGMIAEAIGESDGILVFDPSGFPKSGRSSVGVARQWCGRLGKIDNCQVAVYMAYVSRHEHALADVRLYLPKEWTKDRARCRRAGVPKGTRYRTRHELCLQMLDVNGQRLPHSWITGDDEMGRPYWFRRQLNQRSERYLFSVPSNFLIRDLDSDPPPYCGKGPVPGRRWTRVDAWATDQDLESWAQIDVRDGAKGPLVVEAIKTPVVARTEEHAEGHDEVLVVIRYRDRDRNELLKTDYYLSNAASDTDLNEFARAAKAEHRIEECIQRGKSETGLADYEVRNWRGWHHHQILSMIASWFLVTETRRGKKKDTGNYFSANSRDYRSDPASCVRMRYKLPNHQGEGAASDSKRARQTVPLETAQTIGAIEHP
jgi:SRSO17 transposase